MARPSSPTNLPQGLEERLSSRVATLADWEVYGDALIEQGDPRGELVALSLAIDAATDNDAIEKLTRRRDRLASKIDPVLLARARRTPELFELEWEYGFLDWARVVEPWEPRIPAEQWLRELLAEPAAKLLRALEIDREFPMTVGLGQIGERGLCEWSLPVFDGAMFPHVRSLRIGSEPDEDMHLSETSSGMYTSGPPGSGAKICRPPRWIGDVSSALRALPSLEDLQLTGEGVAFGALPRSLRSLAIQTPFLRQSTLRAIASSSLPELHSLELWLGYWPDSLAGFDGPEGDAFFGPATSARDLEPLLDGSGFPALRILALSNCAWMPELVEALASSKIVGQLTQLDLSYGFMNGTQVGALLDNAKRLRHLARLDLSRNQIDEVMQHRLRDALGPNVQFAPQDPLQGNRALSLLGF